jgi:hypothetical protein
VEAGGAGGLDGEQRVVDRAESGAGDDDEGEGELDGEVADGVGGG